MKKEKSAGAIIFREEKGKKYYLVLHYELGHWGFAKGHIENGEDEITALKREVEEETGIKNIKLIDGFCQKIKYFYGDVSKTVIFYLAKTKGNEIILSEEHIDYEWLPYEGALKRITYKNTKNLLKKVNQFQKNVK